MRAELAALWPETAVGPGRARPAAAGGHRADASRRAAPAPGRAVLGAAPGLRLAGDFVRTPFLTGLMERAAASGVLAANDVLAEVGAGPEEIRGIPQRGLLAARRRALRLIPAT